MIYVNNENNNKLFKGYENHLLRKNKYIQDIIKKVYYSDKTLKSEVTYDGRKDEGIMKIYDEKGTLQCEGKIESTCFFDIIKFGEWKVYKDGKLYQKGNVKDRKKVGLWEATSSIQI